MKAINIKWDADGSKEVLDRLPKAIMTGWTKKMTI